MKPIRRLNPKKNPQIRKHIRRTHHPVSHAPLLPHSSVCLSEKQVLLPIETIIRRVQFTSKGGDIFIIIPKK